ncbi:MAG: DUF7601 domain-containing protein [Lachnospiraceae bacterium]
MGNMSKPGKRLWSILLILVMIIVLLPVNLSAEEGEEQTEEQVISEVESETQAEVNSEPETSVQAESEVSEAIEATQSEESESLEQCNTGSISGRIWLDDNEDGVYDSGEKPVADYEVSLYLSSNTNEIVAMVTTDSSGNYTFKDLASDDYVVGIPLSQKAGDTQYLVPMIGISGDNKFALDKTTYNAYTNTIAIEAGTDAKDYSAGVRMPAGIQTTSVGIKPKSSTTFTINSTVIGFAGHEWWVIGGSSVGSTVSSSSTTLTLWSKNYDFGETYFNSSTASVKNKYAGSLLQTAMNNLNTTMFTSALGNTQESNYVINRTSMDQNSYTYVSDTVASGGTDTYGYGTTSGNFWPLSRGEWGTVYGTGSAANIAVCYYWGSYPYYWLRSPSSAIANHAWQAYCTGTLAAVGGVFSNYNAIRPAFYLDTTSVLFTSNATGSYTKSAASLGSATLQAYTAPSGTIKLTMKDDTNLKLTSSTTAVGSITSGGTVSIAYADAIKGTNNSVSVMILDSSGNIKYYGRPVDLSGSGTASGTASVTIPSGLTAGSYTLKVFNEQVNGDYYTDYASTPVEIPLTIFSVSPAAVTSSATSITSTTATLVGTYNTGGVSGSVYFQYGTTTSMTSTTTSTTLTSSAATSRSVAVSGLSQNTTYYYRMVVVVAGITYTGSTLNFTTYGTPAAVTSAASSIGTTTAVLNGTYNTGGYTGTVYFQYGTTTSFGSTTTSTSLTSSTATARAVTISGLTANTIYYFRMVVVANGTTYTGSTLNFTTYGTPAAVTSAASSIGTTTAVLNGTYNTGGYTGTVYFQYGTTTSFGSTTTSTSLTSSTATARTVTISGLTANTTYYFRMVVVANGSTYTGSTLNFTTQPSITSLAGMPSGTATADITAVFEAGLNNVYPTAVSIMYNDSNSTTGATAVSVGSGSTYASGFLSYGLTGLNPNTTYYLWTAETTAGGTVTYPSTTTSTISVLTYPDWTAWDANRTATSATVSGSYYTGESITAATVVYGTDPTLSSGSEITLTGDKSVVTSGDFVYTDSGFTCDITGLTSGTTYYVQTTVTNASGTTTSTIKPFSITTDLAIDKTVSGQYSDPNKEFDVTITLANGSTPVTGVYNYTSSIGGVTSTGSVNFDASGKGIIKLKHGQTITIVGIVQGYTYTVEETDTFITNGTYSATYSSPTGTVSGTGVTGTFGSATEEVSIANSRTPIPALGLNGTDYQIAAVSFLAVLAVAVTTLWRYRRRKKCQ